MLQPLVVALGGHHDDDEERRGRDQDEEALQRHPAEVQGPRSPAGRTHHPTSYVMQSVKK